MSNKVTDTKMKDKVTIEITNMESNSCPELIYSVGFFGKHYGSGSPCKDETEVKEAIKSCIKWIQKEGDIPFVNDLRIKQQTLF